MSKAVKSFAFGLAVMAAVLAAAACHTKKKVNTVPTTATESTAPPIPTMTTTQAPTTTVATNTDFVQTDTAPPVSSMQLPTDIEELNRVAQSRGLIQDAFFEYNESTLSSGAQAALTAS